MSTDTTIKTVSISNDAARTLSPSNYDDEEGGAISKRGAKTRKQKVNGRVKVTREEGGAMSPGTLDQLVSSRVPGSDSSHAVGATSKMTEGASAIGAVAPAAPIGGAALKPEPKVHLAKSHKKGKVVLTLTKKKRSTEIKKKPVKLLKLNLTGLTRKLKRASGIQKSAKEKTLPEIKEILVKMDLIKKDTAAPEDVLRQIYSDVETMKKRAL
jgi:hypothetical protein